MLKGAGCIHQQTVIDSDTKVGFAKLCSEQTSVTAADLLNDRIIPFFDEQRIPLQRVLTDRDTEFRSVRDKHAYDLYPAVKDVDHTKTKTKSRQTNGICPCLRVCGARLYIPRADS